MPWGFQWLFKSSFMKFMLCCGACGVIFAAIAIPLAIFVIAPRIAGNILNGATFEFISADILEPTETGFSFRAVAKITNTGPIAARVEFNGPATISYGDANIMSVALPALDAVPGVGASINTTAAATILDATAFAGFAKTAIFAKTFDWRLSGSATGRVIGIPIQVSIDKTLTLTGLDGLKNVSILALDFPPSKPGEGIKIAVTANMFNPSPVGMQLGNIGFNVEVNSTRVGVATANNVTVKAGDNVIQMNAVITTVNNTRQENVISDLLGAFLNGRAANFDVIGSSVTPVDPTKPPISWLQKAFVGLSVPFGLPLTIDSNLIRGVEATSFNLVFDPKEPWKPKMSAAGVVARLQLPFVISIAVNSGILNLKMLSDNGVDTIATLDSGWIPVQSNFSGVQGTLKAELAGKTLVIADNQRQAFQNLLKTVVFANGNVSIPLLVTASANATTAAGNISIAGITVRQTLPFAGVNGLAGTPVDIKSVDIVASQPTYIDLRIRAAIVNPSNVQFALNSDINFDLVASGQIVANVLFPNMSLGLGSNEVTAIARYQPTTPAAKDAGSKLIAAFINGDPATVTIQGNPNSTQLGPLGPAFSAIKLSSALPAFTFKDSLVTGFSFPQVAIEFDPANPWSPKMSAPAIVANVKLPWSLDLAAKQVDMTISMLDGVGSSTPIAVLKTGPIPCTSQFVASLGTLGIDIVSKTLDVIPEQQGAFINLFKTILFGSGQVPIPLLAVADAVGNVPAVGDVTISGFKYSSSIQVNGLQGLAGTPISLQSFDIAGGSPEGIKLQFTASIANPSTVTLKLNSDVTLQLMYQGHVLGFTTLPNLNLVLGTNTVTATALFAPTDDAAKAAGTALLNDYIKGKDVTVLISGSPTSSPLPPIAPVLAGVSLSGTLPGLTTKLLKSSRLAIDLTRILLFQVPGSFEATNPTSGEFTITYMKANIYYKDQVLGKVDAQTSIVIPPRATVQSPAIYVSIVLSLEIIEAIFKLLGGQFVGKVVTDRIEANLGGYPLTVSGYEQENIPVAFVPFL
ncbi:hypothetical protein M427DRAFT_158140 [Gonapodya prolifera JEL478]|uniref:Uncharacterized protein n=1 Tax=Gonapodya prolifera (strain JEL478) TaxID=1344416 RepID=A0A139A5B6_GONPJ|nr:hypothetical protein M427DRAFT_158140 [Gonapodya prolifera JEL478]|eukprot:KXS11583.1 hypothetical protein M427DRAFT_158140 [Gonapodya prolifera JEL478]